MGSTDWLTTGAAHVSATMQEAYRALTVTRTRVNALACRAEKVEGVTCDLKVFINTSIIINIRLNNSIFLLKLCVTY